MLALTVMPGLIVYSIFSTSIIIVSLDFYSNLMQLVEKEILYPLERKGNQNLERPGNLPKLKFLLNQINQGESGFKLRSLTLSSLLTKIAVSLNSSLPHLIPSLLVFFSFY